MNNYQNSNIKRMMRTMMVLILVLIFSACNGKIYKISPDKQIGTEEKVTVTVQDNPEEAQVESDVDNTTSSDNTDADATENSGNDNNEGIELDATVPEDSSMETSQANELVDQLFVNQFSNDSAFDLDVPIETLDNTSTSWSFKRMKDHVPVTAYNTFDITKYGGYFIKDTDEKVVYLTFDEGYENGFTPTILDVLKENNVKAAFFITGDYIKRESELVKRMADEGHIVANHSVTHPEFPTLNEQEIYDEIVNLADKYEALTGKKMDPFFRPPAGKYSERVLYLVRKLGFRTVFWSMAYKDWVTSEQPGKEVAYQHVIDNYHNGAIILLHAVSQSNTEALDSIIKELKAQGYRFGSLYELE